MKEQTSFYECAFLIPILFLSPAMIETKDRLKMISSTQHYSLLLPVLV